MEATDSDCSGPWPPGDFMDDELEEGTKRFLEQARELARRRAEDHQWEQEPGADGEPSTD